MNPVDREELINLSGNDLTYHKQGVLFLEKKPYYIVELVKEPYTAMYAVVYDVHPGTDKNPRKKATQEMKNVGVFSNKTRLGQIANMLLPAKKTSNWVENPPLFIAPVVSGRISTLTGKYEDGFYERTPDRMTVVGGKKTLEQGEPTGVFIGMSSIEWADKTHIPLDSLVKALIRNQQHDGFFDLSGNNSDKHNPLGQYYKE